VTLCGIIAYNSAVKKVQIVNAGWSARTAQTYFLNTNACSALQCMGSYSPHLILINLGINNWNQDYSVVSPYPAAATGALQTALDAYNTAMQVGHHGGQGDGCRRGAAGADPERWKFIINQEYFRQAILTLAATNGIPVLRDSSRHGVSAAANPTWYRDTLHCTSVGYAQMQRKSQPQLAQHRKKMTAVNPIPVAYSPVLRQQRSPMCRRYSPNAGWWHQYCDISGCGRNCSPAESYPAELARRGVECFRGVVPTVPRAG